MRVFQLNTFCGVKSTGRIACEIAKLVQDDGGECRIGYGVPGISADAEPFAYQIGHPLERKVHGAMRKLLDAEGYGSYFATRRLIREMRAFHPDIVHLHNLHGCYLHLATLFDFLRQSGVPVVWTLHDCWPFTGHCAYFDYCGCERWQSGCHHCPQKKSYPVCLGLDGSDRNYRMKKKWFANLPLTFVAPCEWMKGPLSASFLAKAPVRVIPNGVNLQVFHPTQSDLRERYHLENAKICLSVASEWDARKGLTFLYEASQRMGEGYRFVVIGLSQEQLAQLPKEMLGLTHTADARELTAWYTLADCFVNPTLEDNMPMVNLEALACGTPVATFATGGCPEAVDPSCGMAIPPKDVDAFCAAIRILASEKNQRTLSCLERAQHFDASRTFRSYLALYKELCP